MTAARAQWSFYCPDVDYNAQGDASSLGEYSDVMRKLSDLVDRYWNGSKSLLNNLKFRGRVNNLKFRGGVGILRSNQVFHSGIGRDDGGVPCSFKNDVFVMEILSTKSTLFLVLLGSSRAINLYTLFMFEIKK